MHHGICQYGQSIMFAWAKNAPPTTLPKDVGFKIDPTEKKFLVLQVKKNFKFGLMFWMYLVFFSFLHTTVKVVRIIF